MTPETPILRQRAHDERHRGGRHLAALDRRGCVTRHRTGGPSDLCASKARNRHDLPQKGLALPQGSVSSMLAPTVFGSLVVFLGFGGVSLPEGTRSPRLSPC